MERSSVPGRGAQGREGGFRQIRVAARVQRQGDERPVPVHPPRAADEIVVLDVSGPGGEARDGAVPEKQKKGVGAGGGLDPLRDLARPRCNQGGQGELHGEIGVGRPPRLLLALPAVEHEESQYQNQGDPGRQQDQIGDPARAEEGAPAGRDGPAR